MAGSSQGSSRWSAWSWQRVLGVQLAGRGEQGGFLDLVDRPLLVAVLDPARAAVAADGDRVQTETDGDQGRSAQRAAEHENLTDGRRALVVSVLRAGWRAGEPRGAAGGDAPRGSAGGWVLTACRSSLHAAGADLDALGRGLLGLGDQDLEHAVLERGLDLLGHRMGGQGD